MNRTLDEILEELHACDSAFAVANLLACNDITGRMSDGQHSPIGRLLETASDVRCAIIDDETWVVWGRGPERRQRDGLLPRNVVGFLELFNRGLFTVLVEPEATTRLAFESALAH